MNRRQFLKSTLFTTIGAVVLSACKKVAKTTKNNTTLMAGIANLATTVATILSFSYIYIFIIKQKELRLL